MTLSPPQSASRAVDVGWSTSPVFSILTSSDGTSTNNILQFSRLTFFQYCGLI